MPIPIEHPWQDGIQNPFLGPWSPHSNDDAMAQQLRAILGNPVASLSDNRPESMILSPSRVSEHWVAGPSKFYPDELLDWDAALQIEPSRPSGTIMVTLKYAGRDVPASVVDPWD